MCTTDGRRARYPLTTDMLKLVVAAALLSMFPGRAAARPIPDGFTVVRSSISPDRKLAVIAPDLDHATDRAHNQLIELATGKVLAVIAGPAAFEHQNHTTLSPRWSADGGLLLWYVDGKWGSYALALLRLERGAVTAQLDLRELAVQHALRAARDARPQAYAAARLEGRDAGAWFRDGLAIDVRPAGAQAKLALPLALDVALTSNPKELDDYPAAARLTGSLTAVVDADGKLTFSKLNLRG